MRGMGGEGWRGKTPHGIPNQWGVGLGALNKRLLPSFAKRERGEGGGSDEEGEGGGRAVGEGGVRQEREGAGEQMRQEAEDEEAERNGEAANVT